MISLVWLGAGRPLHEGPAVQSDLSRFKSCRIVAPTDRCDKLHQVSGEACCGGCARCEAGPFRPFRHGDSLSAAMTDGVVATVDCMHGTRIPVRRPGRVDAKRCPEGQTGPAGHQLPARSSRHDGGGLAGMCRGWEINPGIARTGQAGFARMVSLVCRRRRPHGRLRQ